MAPVLNTVALVTAHGTRIQLLVDSVRADRESDAPNPVLQETVVDAVGALIVREIFFF